jgi:hypothetical protein
METGSRTIPWINKNDLPLFVGRRDRGDDTRTAIRTSTSMTSSTVVSLASNCDCWAYISTVASNFCSKRRNSEADNK